MIRNRAKQANCLITKNLKKAENRKSGQEATGIAVAPLLRSD
jgi:hypothetical protein